MNGIELILEKARKDADLSQEDVAKLAEISVASYRSYENGARKPKYSTAVALQNVLKIDLVSLLFPTTMVEEPEPEYGKPHDTGEDIRRRKALGGDKDNKGLIYVPIAAQAGYTRNYQNTNYISTMDRLYIPGLPYRGDKYRYFDVEGDSMHPTIKDGMQVIGYYQEPDYWHSISDYYIHVIVIDGMILIKRLVRSKKNKGVFWLISDNDTLYPAITIPQEDIREIWVVKRILSWEMPPPKTFHIEE